MKETLQKILRIEVGLNEVLHILVIAMVLMHMYLTHQLSGRVDSLQVLVIAHMSGEGGNK